MLVQAPTAVIPGADGPPRGHRGLLLSALLLPVLLTLLLHGLALQSWGPSADAALMRLHDAQRLEAVDLQPPPPELIGEAVHLPYRLGAPDGTVAGPSWLRLRFELAASADSTWALALSHRTPVLVYLDGRLLANSVPLAEADQPPRNLQIGDLRLVVNVPADWLAAGPHELTLRLGPVGPSVASVSAVTLGPADAVEAADRPRRYWLALRVSTALSALLIGTLLLFAWLVDRRSLLYLVSALHLMMLALLLAPYVLPGPLLPAPAWRMLLDAADVLAKGLAPVVIAAWAAPGPSRVRRLAFGWMALALPVDLWAAWHDLSWTDFERPWPWWALGSRLFILGLAVFVAARALAAQGGMHRFGTALLAGLALWIWIDVTLCALVLPGRWPVVDLNVVAYAGWALWVAVLLHRQLVDNQRREARLRDELACELAQRSAELRDQYAALQVSEQARLAAVEREHLLQEMHDGVGAQLTSARMLASGGQLSAAEMVDVLEDCLREMRLAVDALSVTDGDLGLLLATLRHRLEPALRAGGITLDWRVDDAPRLPCLEGGGGRELARIVQEALSNTVHHAKATRVSVLTRRSPDSRSVQLCISDNGVGLPQLLQPGRGLRNMQQRAARLGARLEARVPASSATGTEWVLELPLGPLQR